MKKVWDKSKWIFLILVNAMPFALKGIFFQIGLMADLYLFVPVFAGLTILNYRNCNNVVKYVLFQSFMLVCAVYSGYVSTCLYYQHISHDSLTPLAGMVAVLLEAAICIIVTIVTAIVKVQDEKNKMKYPGMNS